MFPQSKFSRAFLTSALLAHMVWCWCALGLLVQASLSVLCFLGTRTGTLARPFLKRRESIARKNLELCFPNLSQEERDKLVDENFRSLGMGCLKQVWPGSGRTVGCVNGLT